jgi:hypothetical protein
MAIVVRSVFCTVTAPCKIAIVVRIAPASGDITGMDNLPRN